MNRQTTVKIFFKNNIFWLWEGKQESGRGDYNLFLTNSSLVKVTVNVWSEILPVKEKYENLWLNNIEDFLGPMDKVDGRPPKIFKNQFIEKRLVDLKALTSTAFLDFFVICYFDNLL